MASSYSSSLTDNSFVMPTLEHFQRVLLLEDYNTRIVTLGVMALGMAAGCVGPFLLMRKRALIGDVLSHGALPGIVIAFMIMMAMGRAERSLAGLLTGAFISSMLSVLFVIFIRFQTRLKEDAAMGVSLSVFFGFGIALLSLVQKGSSKAAGLDHFIYGKTASMLLSDAKLVGLSAVVIIVAVIFLFKEFRLLCFDQAFAASQGWPVLKLDILLMALVIAVTEIGLQAVGIILMIALLIIPAAAARFWTYQLKTMIIVSALIGAISGWLGAMLSALVPRLPAGAIIVLVSGIIFTFSMFFGGARGICRRFYIQWSFRRKINDQNLLRAFYELLEAKGSLSAGEFDRDKNRVSFNKLFISRTWSRRLLKKIVRRAIRHGFVYSRKGLDSLSLTREGFHEAARIVRNHRLWEAYLIHYAEVAPSQVDHEADRIEHVLDPYLIKELEKRIKGDDTQAFPLPSM